MQTWHLNYLSDSLKVSGNEEVGNLKAEAPGIMQRWSGCCGRDCDAGSLAPGITSTGTPLASSVRTMSISLHSDRFSLWGRRLCDHAAGPLSWARLHVPVLSGACPSPYTAIGAHCETVGRDVTVQFQPYPYPSTAIGV